MSDKSIDNALVLVVDDNPDTLHFVTDALEATGMTVLVAVDGESALSAVAQVMPDVILLDAVMPGMDGFETCRRLKRSMAAHVPVIFMTGLNETEHIVHGLEAGGIDYLTKPIAPNELLARIRVHVTNARVAHRSMAALDLSGKPVISVSRDGELLWATQSAEKILGLPANPDPMTPRTSNAVDQTTWHMPLELQDWLKLDPLTAREASAPVNGVKLVFKRLRAIGNTEQLMTVHLAEGSAKERQSIIRLQEQLQLTQREAEVLFWISRGKSNRDIADILAISPRTVNKHLEHIYIKQGVESRSAATALAMRWLGEEGA